MAKCEVLLRQQAFKPKVSTEGRPIKCRSCLCHKPFNLSNGWSEDFMGCWHGRCVGKAKEYMTVEPDDNVIDVAEADDDDEEEA